MPAKFRVEITLTAQKDIEELYSFIAEDSSLEAEKFISRLEDQIKTLEIFPERCSLIPENELLGTQYRHLLSGNYRTIFRVFGKIIYVLRIIHGARLFDSEIFEEKG